MLRISTFGLPISSANIHWTISTVWTECSTTKLFVPAVPCPTTETEHTHELFKEMKRATQLAKKNIQKTQGHQKKQHDEETELRIVTFMLET